MNMPSGTLLFALIGNPVSHSLSPFIMNKALNTHEMDGLYIAVGVGHSGLATAVNGLSAMGALGFNVTYPFKEEVMFHLDAVAPEADTVQAVNTVALIENELHGFNTDAPGTTTALETFAEVPPRGENIFIFGAGGAARAAAHGLLQRGAAHVTLATRSPQKSKAAADAIQYAFPEQEVSHVDLGNSLRVADAVQSARIVINATPVGMDGVKDGCVISDPKWIHADQCYFDFVYHPKNTRFLQMARSRGAQTLGGLALLVSQAMESFRLWTGNSFDVKEMAESVEAFSTASTESNRKVN